MRTLKRAVIILALLIPFLFTIPIVEMIAPCSKPCHPELVSGSLSRIGVRGLTSLFSVQSAEAYTYQDVENAYNNAVAQYPNDYIWIEEFNQDGQKGYRLWRRTVPDAVATRKIYSISDWIVDWYPGQWHYVLTCLGNASYYTVVEETVRTFYYFHYQYSGFADETKCDGSSVTRIYHGIPFSEASNDAYCFMGEYTITDCRDNDVLLAEFIPIDECLDNDGDGYSTCTGDCNDNDSAINPGAKEKCDGKDNNCNGDIDEGACDPCLELRLNSSANAANGNLSHNQELFTSRSTGLSISMTLYYNSLYSGSGHIGTGWSHSYDITLKEFTDGSILFREGNDRKLYVFSNGSYVNQAGDYSTLIKNTDGSYILTKRDGTKYTFDTSGKLMKIEDRLGNAMTFVYTGGDPSTGSGQRLTEITDSVVRKTTLSYNSIVTAINNLT